MDQAKQKKALNAEVFIIKRLNVKNNNFTFFNQINLNCFIILNKIILLFEAS